jgi:hypothetical protein
MSTDGLLLNAFASASFEAKLVLEGRIDCLLPFYEN